VKATSLGHPGHTEARPQYKASNIYQPEDWKVQVPSRKNKMLGSCLLATAGSLFNKGYLFNKEIICKVGEGHSEGISGQ
jgi:hypothetical protein